jgi:hypothetical protein
VGEDSGGAQGGTGTIEEGREAEDERRAGIEDHLPLPISFAWVGETYRID